MIRGGAYSTIFRLAVLHTLKNYKSLIALSIFLITCMLIFAHLWKVVATQIGSSPFGQDQLLWYIAFNEWVIISLPQVQEDMEHDLRSGKLAYLLPRPISYPMGLFFEALGALCVHLFVLGIVTFCFTWICIGHIPFALSAFPLIVGIGFLAGVVGLLFHILIGISAFWIQQVEPFFWIWEKFLFTLGGLMFPLSIYPLWLQKIASCTPFPAILGARSALAIHFSLQEAFAIILSLLFWGMIAVCSCMLLYRKGLKIVTIGGG